MQWELEICLQRWQLNKKFHNFCPWWVKKFSYRRITKLCINCYQPGHIKKNCKKIQQLAGLTNVQKFKEEHDFSDELYRNWIKILGLNQVRKKKAKKTASWGCQKPERRRESNNKRWKRNTWSWERKLSDRAESRKTIWRKRRRNSTIKGCKIKKKQG